MANTAELLALPDELDAIGTAMLATDILPPKYRRPHRDVQQCRQVWERALYSLPSWLRVLEPLELTVIIRRYGLIGGERELLPGIAESLGQSWVTTRMAQMEALRKLELAMREHRNLRPPTAVSQKSREEPA